MANKEVTAITISRDSSMASGWDFGLGTRRINTNEVCLFKDGKAWATVGIVPPGGDIVEVSTEFSNPPLFEGGKNRPYLIEITKKIAVVENDTIVNRDARDVHLLMFLKIGQAIRKRIDEQYRPSEKRKEILTQSVTSFFNAETGRRELREECQFDPETGASRATLTERFSEQGKLESFEVTSFDPKTQKKIRIERGTFDSSGEKQISWESATYRRRDGELILSYSKTYDPETGKLTVSKKTTYDYSKNRVLYETASFDENGSQKEFAVHIRNKKSNGEEVTVAEGKCTLKGGKKVSFQIEHYDSKDGLLTFRREVAFDPATGKAAGMVETDFDLVTGQPSYVVKGPADQKYGLSREIAEDLGSKPDDVRFRTVTFTS